CAYDKDISFNLIVNSDSDFSDNYFIPASPHSRCRRRTPFQRYPMSNTITPIIQYSRNVSES
ncbi:9293_t:CDS:2, partial [Gigaspora rosea]